MNFITGRSGYGKSTYCLEEIKKSIESGFSKPMFYIVPEQFSFEAEKKLIEITNKKGIMDVQVLSFKRLAYRFFSENNITFDSISDSAKAILVFNIMNKLDKHLLVLKGVLNNIGIVNTVVNEISEFKRYGVTPDMLQNVETKDEFLNLKLHDLSLIYDEYVKNIKEKYLDGNDKLTLLCESIKQNPSFLKNARIWIDEFDGFVPQELNVIKELDKCADVTIAITTGEDEFFKINNEVFNKLQEISKNNKGVVNSSNFEKFKNTEIKSLNNQKRFLNDELCHLEANIFKPFCKTFESDCNNVFVTSYANSYEEIENVAKKIRKLANNTRYENIQIITRDIEKYKNIIKMVFPLYDIPYFFDDKKELAFQPIISLITSLCELVNNNYKYESMFSYLKTGLTNIADEDEIDLIENYVLKWGIRGKKWEEDFTYSDELLDKINSIRKEIVEPIISFKNSFDGKKTVKEIVTAIYEFLVQIKTFDNISSKVKSFNDMNDSSMIRNANEYAQVWNILMTIFDDLNTMIGNEYVSFERFVKTFKVAIMNREIGVIPSTIDKVVIGDVERTRSNNVLYLFIIGMEDSCFPKIYSNEGFINDDERENLLENGIELAKPTTKLLKQEIFNIYKAFSVPREKLFISYPLADLEGKTIRPSYIINDIKKIFPNVSSLEVEQYSFTPKSSFGELLDGIRKQGTGDTIGEREKSLRRWFEKNDVYNFSQIIKATEYSNEVNNQSNEISKMMYGDSLYTSVSRLELFVNCPYSYYLRYGLHLKDRELYKLMTPDVGSLLHEVIEHFSKKILEENINVSKLEKDECDRIVDEISSEAFSNFRYDIFNSTGKLKTLAIKLKKLIRNMIWIIVLHIKSGKFNLIGSEVEFGRGKELPEIIIDINENDKVYLFGKIDRVDVASVDGTDYVRIVDYKSSDKAIKLSNVYYGVQLQLLTYSDAVSFNDLKFGGAFYLKLDDPILKTDKRITKEEIEEQIIKKLRMNGIAISNVKLIQAMDEKLDNSDGAKAVESNVINLKISKDGNYSKMPVVSYEDFEKIKKRVHFMIKSIAKEILNGNVKNQPLNIKNKTIMCSYCNYREICKFDGCLGNKERRFNDLKDEDVLKLLNT